MDMNLNLLILKERPENYLVKEGTMGVAWGTGMRDEKWIQSFGRKA
jgi:hypothetical protein